MRKHITQYTVFHEQFNNIKCSNTYKTKNLLFIGIVQVRAMHRILKKIIVILHVYTITLKLARYSSPKQLFSQGKVHSNFK